MYGGHPAASKTSLSSQPSLSSTNEQEYSISSPSIRSQRLPSSHPIFLIIQQILLSLSLTQPSTSSRRQRRILTLRAPRTLHTLRPTSLSRPTLNSSSINLHRTSPRWRQHRHTHTLLHPRLLHRQRINPFREFRDKVIVSSTTRRFRAQR